MTIKTTGKSYQQNASQVMSIDAVFNARRGKAIANLASQDFSLPDDEPFIIKNDNDDVVILEVKYIDGDDTWVSTKFQVGWNPDIVKAIKTTATGGALLWG